MVHGVASAQLTHQPGAGAVSDLVVDATRQRVLIAAAPGGLEIYSTGTTPTRLASAALGFAGKRISFRGDTVAVTVAGDPAAGGGVATYDVGGPGVDGLGHSPGYFVAVSVASNEATVYGAEQVLGNPSTVHLRTYSRSGGGYIATRVIGPTVADLIACGGTSGSVAGSRVYVATGTGRTVRVFDGVPIPGPTPPPGGTASPPTFAELAPARTLTADAMRLTCDPQGVWVGTTAGATLLRAADLSVVRTVATTGRAGLSLRGNHLLGVQYADVRVLDTTSTVQLGAIVMQGASGIDGDGSGVGWVGNISSGVNAAKAGLYRWQYAAGSPVPTPPTQPPAASPTRTATGAATASSTPTATRSGAPGMCVQYPEGSGRLVPCSP